MKRGNRLRRATPVLALLLLAATVTGVAESATKTANPKLLTGRWNQWDHGKSTVMVVSRPGRVEIDQSCSASLTTPATCTSYDDHAEFSHVTAHRLRISGIPSCSGTGRYRWTITLARTWVGSRDYAFRLTKIHDPCKARVNLFAHNDWWRN